MFIKNPALAETIARTLHTTPDQLTKEDMKELIQLDASTWRLILSTVLNMLKTLKD